MRLSVTATACAGTIGGYREWRKNWMNLDRYAGEPDRRLRVVEILEKS